MTKVLAADPGSRFGFSVWQDGELLEFGAITTDSKLGMRERLNQMETNISLLFDKVSPDVVVVEDVNKGSFKSWQARAWLGRTYGHVDRLAYEKKLDFVPIAPTEMKKIVTGSGRAKKIDVIHAVNKLLNLSLGKSKDDEADAIALGICYYELHDL